MGCAITAHFGSHVGNEDMPSVIYLHVVADKAKGRFAFFPHVRRKFDFSEQ